MSALTRAAFVALIVLWGMSAGPAFAGSQTDKFLNEMDSFFTNLGEEFNRISKGTTRTVVDFPRKYKKGEIVVSTKERKLYYVLGRGQALRYSVGVGREGFTWGGVSKVSRKAKWPDWRPPAEMLERQPDLPTFMPGGPDNPLGARALYLGTSLYRIHGTRASHTIGSAISSGCIRMLNDDVIDLYNRVNVGAKVYVYH